VVVGRPDPILGQVPVAFVTVRPPSAAVGQVLSRLRDRCTTALPAPKRPMSVTALRAMPVGPTGKIQRHRLAAPEPGGILGHLRLP